MRIVGPTRKRFLKVETGTKCSPRKLASPERLLGTRVWPLQTTLGARIILTQLGSRILYETNFFKRDYSNVSKMTTASTM